MERLCDEVLQLIFYELPDPSSLTLVSQRLNRFSQDAYVRAHYFLTHYGPVEAMFYALGRGKILNEEVLDILLSSGAQLSRYLIQIAMHHYFHTQSHFIKTHWVRSVPLRVFTHLLQVAEERFGDIPRGKGEDDGSIFMTFLKESRVPLSMKAHSWETIKTLLETYKFIPFSQRDPLMALFPLALAIEPKLLPSAISNGFSMDYKHQNFVFRKMFERPTLPGDITSSDIANNVRELCKLDPAMFVSRTIAAEVCMEAKSNDVGYTALKQLDKSSDLRFELSTLVEDLLKTFLTTRSICSISTGDGLLHLFSDFPSADASVRLVVLIIVFISADDLNMSLPTLRAKLESLGLMPITRKDVFNILVNPFVESFSSLLQFALEEIGVKEGGSKGMSAHDCETLVAEVVAKCVEISCKGKLVKRLCEIFPVAKKALKKVVLSKHQIEVDDVPSWYDGNNMGYKAALSRDYITSGAGDVHTLESLMPEQKSDAMDVDDNSDVDSSSNEEHQGTMHPDMMADEEETLGGITQETLTAMIRHDEAVPVRSRRRNIYVYSPLDLSGKMRYPHDALPVAKWVKTQYGPRSAVVAVFMTHAVVNGNGGILHYYLDMGLGFNSSNLLSVPVTLKHFRLLARLGRSPSYYMWASIELGAVFYFDEDDYLSESAKATRRDAKMPEVKIERDPTPGSSLSGKGKKRPRRSAAAAVVSYAVPDSDDDSLNMKSRTKIESKKNARQENRLQLWIKHLSCLLKTETKKLTALKKRLEKESTDEVKVTVYKNDFIKSLATNLRMLRKLESANRSKNPTESVIEPYSDNEDDDEFVLRRTKRRRSFEI